MSSMLGLINRLLPRRKKAAVSILKSVPMAKGRRLVIPDIHGCILTLNALLEKVQLRKDDQLFLLGDYISKGPDSRKVLDRIMQLERAGFRIYKLRGNHEQMLIDCLEKRPYELKWLSKKLGFRDLLNWRGSVDRKYRRFLEQLHHAIVLDDYILVHAGLDFAIENPLENLHDMLWTKSFKYDKDKVGGRRLVHGHYPMPLLKIEKRIASQGPVFKLDNGCVYVGDRIGHGNLLCLDLDTLQLWQQKCLDT